MRSPTKTLCLHPRSLSVFPHIAGVLCCSMATVWTKTQTHAHNEIAERKLCSVHNTRDSGRLNRASSAEVLPDCLRRSCTLNCDYGWSVGATSPMDMSHHKSRSLVVSGASWKKDKVPQGPTGLHGWLSCGFHAFLYSVHETRYRTFAALLRLLAWVRSTVLLFHRAKLETEQRRSSRLAFIKGVRSLLWFLCRQTLLMHTTRPYDLQHKKIAE